MSMNATHSTHVSYVNVRLSFESKATEGLCAAGGIVAESLGPEPRAWVTMRIAVAGFAASRIFSFTVDIVTL